MNFFRENIEYFSIYIEIFKIMIRYILQGVYIFYGFLIYSAQYFYSKYAQLLVFKIVHIA